MKQGAALLLQGLTAHYLTYDTVPVKEGDVVLVHAAAGGTGLLVTQMAKYRGAKLVIGVVGGGEKAALARSVGKCDAVIDYSITPDWPAEVLKLTDGKKAVSVVFDGVGKSTFAGSLASLKPRGMLVTFGNASGAVDPIAPLDLCAAGSISLCRPKLGDYMLTEEEKEARIASLVALVEGGHVTVTIGAVIKLEEAAKAHTLLESRATTGKIILDARGDCSLFQ